MAKRKPKSEEPEVVVPKDRTEAAEFIRQIGEKQRGIQAAASYAESRIALIKQQAQEKTAPLDQEIDELVAGLFAFFEEHKDELTEVGNRKTVDLGTGTIGEHTNPHKVEIRNVEKVIEQIQSLGKKMADFLRIPPPEVNREAMTATEESRARAVEIKGVKITQTTEFRVKPSGELEGIVRDESRLKRRISKK